MIPLRASSLGVGANCPGGPAFLASFGDKVWSEFLGPGTDAHAWLHLELGGGPAPDNPDPGIPWEWIATMAEEYGLDFDAGTYEAAAPPLELGGCLLTGHPDYFNSSASRLVVLDWKWGEGQKWISPPISEWYQGLAYGLMTYNGEDEVVFLRVRVSDQEVDALTVPGRLMGTVVLSGIEDIAEAVAAAPDTKKPGPWCENCLARGECPEFMRQAEAWTALPVPAVGVLTASQAERWAVARVAVKVATAAADEALKAYVAAGGEVKVEGRRLALGGTSRDKVVRPDIVQEVVGAAAVEVKVTASKSRITKALMAQGMTGRGGKAERESVFAELREKGAIVVVESTGTLRWRKG